MRLPRKLKKQVKKKVAAKTASKMVMSAIVTVQTMAQNAIIASRPVSNYTGATVAEKSLAVAQNLIGAAKAIQNIMLESPNSWRDFVKWKDLSILCKIAQSQN